MKTTFKGRISEIQRQSYTIFYDYKTVKAKLKGIFFKSDLDRPVIGDYVLFDYNPSGISVINEIIERNNVLKRPDQSGHAAGYVKTMKEQILAANFEYIFIVTSLNQNYNINRITRYVTATLQSKAKPVVILTKADLCDDSSRYVEEVKNISEDVEVNVVSAITGEGMKNLNKYMVSGTTIVLAGSSGVGKSTLVNAIAGEEIMKVSEIRASDARGHHTTTHRQLVLLPSGVTIIDEPGIRELGMCDVEEGLDNAFDDIKELVGQCRFSNCNHNNEPGCAIKEAIENGTLSIDRWKIYASLSNENSWGTKMLKSTKKRRV